MKVERVIRRRADSLLKSEIQNLAVAFSLATRRVTYDGYSNTPADLIPCYRVGLHDQVDRSA